jgi:DNA-binding SARP family transcriptional activator
MSFTDSIVHDSQAAAQLHRQPQFQLQLQLQLQLHGYPCVRRGGRTLPLRLRHGFALLTLLAERGRPVARDELAARLWPDARPGVGRARLRRLLHELQQHAGQPVAEGDVQALTLASGWQCDLQATRRAMRAGDSAALVAARAAELMTGFSLPGGAFDDWLEDCRREHRAALTRALERAARALSGHDGADADEAESVGLALLRLEPCAEAGHGARLWAQALRLDGGGVEAAYFDAADALRGEYGMAPSPRFEALYEAARRRVAGRSLALAA